MEVLPLSSDEASLLSKIVEEWREAAARLAEHPGKPPTEKCWWEQDPVLVTEVASGWGGIGSDEALATFDPRHTEFLWARMSALPEGQASSLILLDAWRGPLVVRFRRHRKKRKTLRFMVGEPGCRGSVWRLWTGIAEDDVYLADRHSSQWAKFSLHASGDWRLQWTTENRAEVPVIALQGPAPRGRVMARWDAPPAGVGGWTHAMSICTAAQDVLDVPGDNQTGNSPVKVPTPPPGWMVEFAVFMVEPDSALLDLSPWLATEGTSLSVVGGYLLASGRTVVVFAFTKPTPPGMEDLLRAARLDSRERHRHSSWSLDPSSGPRSLGFFGPQGDQPATVWDIGLN